MEERDLLTCLPKSSTIRPTDRPTPRFKYFQPFYNTHKPNNSTLYFRLCQPFRFFSVLFRPCVSTKTSMISINQISTNCQGILYITRILSISLFSFSLLLSARGSSKESTDHSFTTLVCVLSTPFFLRGLFCGYFLLDLGSRRSSPFLAPSPTPPAFFCSSLTLTVQTNQTTFSIKHCDN